MDLQFTRILAYDETDKLSLEPAMKKVSFLPEIALIKTKWRGRRKETILMKLKK